MAPVGPPVSWRDVSPADWPWPNFAPQELACRGTGLMRLHPGFMNALQALRVAFGKPMTVTSGCRTKAYNDRPRDQGGVGGHPRSLHVCDEAQHPGQQGTLAVDIAVTNAAAAWDLVALAMNMDWSVGVPKAGFIHLDRRDLIGLPRGLFGY